MLVRFCHRARSARLIYKHFPTPILRPETNSSGRFIPRSPLTESYFSRTVCLVYYSALPYSAGILPGVFAIRGNPLILLLAINTKRTAATDGSHEQTI